MGVCGSKAKGCVPVGLHRDKKHDHETTSSSSQVNGIANVKRKRRRRRIGRKSKKDVANNRYSGSSAAVASNSMDRRSFRNPAFQGTIIFIFFILI